MYISKQNPIKITFSFTIKFLYKKRLMKIIVRLKKKFTKLTENNKNPPGPIACCIFKFLHEKIIYFCRHFNEKCRISGFMNGTTDPIRRNCRCISTQTRESGVYYLTFVRFMATLHLASIHIIFFYPRWPFHENMSNAVHGTLDKFKFLSTRWHFS